MISKTVLAVQSGCWVTFIPRKRNWGGYKGSELNRPLWWYAIYIRALLHHTLPLASSSVTPTIYTSSLGSLINLLCGLYRSSAHVLLCLQTAHSFSRPSDVLISDPVNSVVFLGGFFGFFFSQCLCFQTLHHIRSHYHRVNITLAVLLSKTN